MSFISASDSEARRKVYDVFSIWKIEEVDEFCELDWDNAEDWLHTFAKLLRGIFCFKLSSEILEFFKNTESKRISSLLNETTT